MSGIRKHLRYVSFFMAMMMALGSVWSASATAGMVGTGEMIGQQQVQLDRQELIGMLDRQDVQAKLADLGVSQDQVKERIQNLTPAELADFERQLAEALQGRMWSASSCCSCWYSLSPICFVPRTSSRS